MNKREIRQKIKAIRAVMDPRQAETFSEAIKNKLISLERVKRAGRIMAFYSHKNEPQMFGFINECLKAGKSVSLPCITGEGKMIAAGYCADTEMQCNIYGIPEPVVSDNTEQERPDIVIVPGLAFDLHLNRIGLGGGYYDRFLEGKNVYKIGVCFDYQIVENIDAASHDVPMDIVVTEERIIGDI